MPAPLAEVVRSRGPAIQTTFDDDTKKKPRERIAANEPNGFLAMSPRHADDGEGSNGSDGSEDDAADGFEDAPEEAEDTTIDELLDDMQARLNRDVQKRMNEHGRNWRLIDSKANTELADKLEDQRDKREQRAHSKLRVAQTSAGLDHGSAAAKARRHQQAWLLVKRQRKDQRRFLRRQRLFAGILNMIVERTHQQATASEAPEAAGAAPSPTQAPPSRPRPTPLEKLVLAEIKQALLGRAGLLHPQEGSTRRTQPDPRKVSLPKMEAREIFYTALANDHVMPLEEFEKREAKQTIAFLRAALQIPDDSYRHWLSQRSMLNYYTVSPKRVVVAFCSTRCILLICCAQPAPQTAAFCAAPCVPPDSVPTPPPTTAPNNFLLVVEFVLWAGRWSPSIEYEY